MVSQPTRTEVLPHAEGRRRYPERQLVRGFEGGVIHSADARGEFVLIVDESTMLDLVDEEDRDLVPQGVTVLIFGTAEDRAAYATSRGWVPRR